MSMKQLLDSHYSSVGGNVYAAWLHVRPHVAEKADYAVIEKRYLPYILGSNTIKNLLDDPIRQLGSDLSNMYVWNVIDYILDPECGKRKREKENAR